MSLEESSVLMDRALVTMCQDLPESLGLYNTEKDQLVVSAIRTVPLLEKVGCESRKLALIRDWMRTFEPFEDQELSGEIDIELLKEIEHRERKEKEERELQCNVQEKEKKKERHEVHKNRSSEQRRMTARKHHGDMDTDADDALIVVDSSISNDESSSETSSSSESDSDGKRKTRKIKKSSNLPSKIKILSSSDEDEEPNDMFDTDDPDVYEVEKILRKKTGENYGDQDLYEVKWEGYEETTWEPASNISKDLIDEFEGQPVREDVYTVQEIRDRRSERDPTTGLMTHQYKVKWVGYDDLTWEPAENLPHNLRRKFDQKYESRKRRRT